MSQEWGDRLPGYDAWRTREHNRLFWFEEEQVMDEREAEEKRDAEIRGGWEIGNLPPTFSAKKSIGGDHDEVLVHATPYVDGVEVAIWFSGSLIFMGPEKVWEQIAYGVERALEEAR